MMTAITLTNINKKYFRSHALRDINLNIEEGEILVATCEKRMA